jgi:hypothetical protein
MKKTRLLSVLFLLFLTVSSFAQHQVVTIGKLPAPKLINGKSDVVYATPAQLVANGQFVSSQPGCKVTGYTFSILPNGADFIGPYTVSGAAFSPKLVSFFKDPNNKKGRLFFEKITTTCDGAGNSAEPIAVRYSE